MTQIFVSSCRVDAPPASSLIERLREQSFSILHSPRNPSDGEDTRWRNWYEKGCRDEIKQTTIFITVISKEWDGSTWMAQEAHNALKLMEADKLQRMYFWNPEQIEVRASGMSPYLRDRLPDDLGESVQMLKENYQR